MMLTKKQARRLGQVLRDAQINTCRVVQRQPYGDVVLTVWSPKGETIAAIDEYGEQRFLRLPA